MSRLAERYGTEVSCEERDGAVGLVHFAKINELALLWDITDAPSPRHFSTQERGAGQPVALNHTS